MWLVVTPAKDEQLRLPALAASLKNQESQLVGLWVIVDDGSSDATSTAVDAAEMPFSTRVLRRDNKGGLRAGSDHAAFLAGAGFGLKFLPDATRVMRLDADITLAPSYFLQLQGVADSVGLTGGVIASWSEIEQTGSVRGALKAYNRRAWDLVRHLPPALGMEVMDEVAIRRAGLDIHVVPSAHAFTDRPTSSSEGLLRGRVRNGEMCRLCGYHGLYFALRVFRYVFRKPYIAGAFAMVVGFVRAGNSPYDDSLRNSLRAEQILKLRALARSPISWLKRAYEVPQ